jgi:hypothetical protein
MIANRKDMCSTMLASTSLNSRVSARSGERRFARKLQGGNSTSRGWQMKDMILVFLISGVILLTALLVVVAFLRA